MPTPYHLLTLSELEWALNTVDYISLDTETNGEDIRDGRGYMTGLSITVEIAGQYFAGYFPFRHGSGTNLEIQEQEVVRNAIANYKGVMLLFNAKFDLVSLATAGINYDGLFMCLQSMCHLINENFPFEKSLDGCVHAYVSKEESKRNDIKKYAEMVGWADVDPMIMGPYAEYDAILTLMLWKAIKDKVKAENLEKYWFEHKMDVFRMVIDMERRGVRIDTPKCEKLATLGEEILNDLQDSLGGVNLGSPVVLNKLLVEELELPVVKQSAKTGKPSFDKEAMAIYDAVLERVHDPTANLIKQYRGWKKSVTSNYLPYLALISPDGRLRPNYRLARTRTGRWSCSDPNLQQIPRVSNKEWNGDMKGCFIPEDGFELWEFDYAQLELRLAAAFGREQSLLKAFAEDRDVFEEMSKQVGMPRWETKQFTYATQYGAGVGKAALVLGTTEDVTRAARARFKSAYPGMQRKSDEAAAHCRKYGKIKLWSGRYRHFWDRKEDAHKAFNSAMQGGAADIVERQLVKAWKTIDNEEYCRLLLQIHDSGVFEIRKDKVEELVPLIKQTMEDVTPDFGVKFKVEAKIWGT